MCAKYRCCKIRRKIEWIQQGHKTSELLLAAICPSCFSHYIEAAGHAEGAGLIDFYFSSSWSRTSVTPAVAFPQRAPFLLTRARGAQLPLLTCSFLLLTKAVWGITAGFNPPCHSRGGSQTVFRWQREIKCDAASSRVHHENALPSLILMRNPSCLWRTGISWLIMWLHHLHP